MSTSIIAIVLLSLATAIFAVLRDYIKARREFKKLKAQLEAMVHGDALFQAPRKNKEIVP